MSGQAFEASVLEAGGKGGSIGGASTSNESLAAPAFMTLALEFRLAVHTVHHGDMTTQDRFALQFL